MSFPSKFRQKDLSSAGVGQCADKRYKKPDERFATIFAPLSPGKKLY